MVRAPVPGSVGERLRLVREATKLRLEDFVSQLNRESSRRFGAAGPTFNGGRVSKLELGVQRAALDDIAVYAALDPLRRGKLWLGFNEWSDSAVVAPDVKAGRAAEPEPAYGPENATLMPDRRLARGGAKPGGAAPAAAKKSGGRSR